MDTYATVNVYGNKLRFAADGTLSVSVSGVLCDGRNLDNLRVVSDGLVELINNECNKAPNPKDQAVWKRERKGERGGGKGSKRQLVFKLVNQRQQTLKNQTIDNITQVSTTILLHAKHLKYSS